MAEKRALIVDPDAGLLTTVAEQVSRFVANIADQVATTLEGPVLRRKAEIEEERLSLLMEAVDDAVWLVDADLRLVAQNEAACEMLGWSLTEAIGRSVDEIVSSSRKSPGELGQLLKQTMEKQQRVSFDEGVSLTTKNDGPIVVNGRAVPIVREDQAVGAICAFRELPSEKDGMQLRFEFANMASHLLRTPLSSIYALIDLLLSSELDAEEQRAMLDEMQEQSRRMKKFITELLEMSRVEAGAINVYSEVVVLRPLIERVLEVMQHEEAGHVFRLAANDMLPVVAADPGKIELVVLTLLRSAVGRCPNGGTVIIELEERASEVIVSIVDDGEAIPPRQLHKVFWQFYPVDDDGKMPSTYHLGLYTVRRLIEMQNGHMWVQSQPGQGSRFSFSLPVWG